MITDFIIHQGIQGLRANNFGSGNRAIAVSENQSIVEIPGVSKNREKLKSAESEIDQSAFSLTLSEEGKALSQSQKSSNGKKLTEEEQKEIEELKERDAEVRAHEQAHMAAAGQHGRGGISFDFENGADGRQYAVGGQVDIDTAPVPNDPEATIAKARQVRQAALAPAEPSNEDRQVAQDAAKMEMEARAKLREKTDEESGTSNSLKESEIVQTNQDIKNQISDMGTVPTAQTRSLESNRISQLFSSYRPASGTTLNIVA